MSFQNPLAKAKGLGSAHNGVEHWWWQKITALMLIVLLIYLPISLLMLGNFSIESVQTWMARPLISVAMVGLLISGYYHMWLGLQVIIEDYVHSKFWEVFSLFMVRSVCWAAAILSTLAVLKNSIGIS
ncbi:MAG: succinate dehydrogenase, hydrophobic membrane anchor protein [bacterium]